MSSLHDNLTQARQDGYGLQDEKNHPLFSALIGS